MATVSRVVATTPHSAIRTVGELARTIPDALRLEAGDPDFGTPDHIIEATARAARDGFTHYGPSAGLESLRTMLLEKVRTRNNLDCDIGQVVVTAGACGALYSTLLTLLDPGDEVMIPDPAWPNYPAMIHVLGGVTTRYGLDPALAWAPDIASIEAAITPRTKVIVVNSPGNPTGGVHARGMLRAILDVAERNDLWVVSDECYDEIVFDGEHVSMASLGGSDRVISIFSFSKTYAMTGWRVGYLVAPPAIAMSIARAQEPIYACASTIAQKAAEAALAGPQTIVRTMCDAYRARGMAAMTRLDTAGIAYVAPQGAFYLMVDTPPGESSLDFARRLLVERHVAVVPGSAFGERGEGRVRVALCVAMETLSDGVDRLVAGWASSRSGPA